MLCHRTGRQAVDDGKSTSDGSKWLACCLHVDFEYAQNGAHAPCSPVSCDVAGTSQLSSCVLPFLVQMNRNRLTHPQLGVTKCNQSVGCSD